MSIKPCPACSGAEHALVERAVYFQRACVCGASGPLKLSRTKADAAWNAMPRRGDGPAWRSEPPDRVGYWWKRLRSPSGAIVGPWIVNVSDIRCEASSLGEFGADYEWAGPTPEPPAPAAEKEAAK